MSDKTGATGVFDIDFSWMQSPRDEFFVPGSADPAMISAIQDTLGLKFENAKGKGEVLVIDHAGKPSEN